MFTSIPKFTISDVDLTTERKGQFMFEGSAASGVYGEIGVALLAKKLLSSGFRFEAGVEVGGEIMLYNADKDVAQYSTSVYEKLRATELYVKPFCKVGLEARMLSVGKGDINIFERKWTGDTFKLVPSFANTTLIREPSDPHLLKASTKAFARSLFPCDLGFRLIKEGSDTSTDCNNLLHYANTPQTYEHYFTIEDFGKKYTLYPIVELLGLGISMRALPGAELKLDIKPITLRAEEITDTTAMVWGKIENHDLMNGTVKYGLGYIEAGRASHVKYVAHSIDKNGNYSVKFKALKPNTTYQYYAYIIINGETYYGESKEFTTKKVEAYRAWDETSTIVTYYYDGKRDSLKGWEISENHEVFYGKPVKVVFDESFSRYYPKSFSFQWCSELQSIDNLNYLNTDSITDMNSMFYRCSSLTELDLSSFNTSYVTDMSSMFQECSSLTSLDLSNFDTSNVTNMSSMFSSCYSLTSLDLSSFNTSYVTDMSSMFQECSSLTSLDLSNFDTSNVTNMNHMFQVCKSLPALDVSHFNTSNVTTMRCMFTACDALTILDLTNFDTSNVTDMTRMFCTCHSIKTIYAGNWNRPANSSGMFESSHNLVGGKGTKKGRNLYGYDKNGDPLYYDCPGNGSAAHIDGGKDWPGLFTEK
jgi:surface protein